MIRLSLFTLLLFTVQIGTSQVPALTYASYLGGREPDLARAVATDRDGNIYVTGTTYSRNFPTTPGAYQSQCLLGSQGGCTDIFVAKFDPTGSRLIYATYIGSRSNDEGNDIAVDSLGNAVITGAVGSDLIAMKLNPAGQPLWTIGYTAPPLVAGRALALDRDGNVYITGETFSRTLFTRNALQATAGANSCTAIGGGSFPLEAFVIKLSPQGETIFSTYLGGDGNDLGRDVAVDAGGNIYVLGETSSSNFPLRQPLQAAYAGGAPQGPGQCTGGDLFLTKISPNGQAIESSTYLGGSGTDRGLALAVDPAGNVFIGGETTSFNFPVTAGGPSAGSGFLAKIGASGRIVFSSYAGLVTAVLPDSLGNIYVAGQELRRFDALGRSSQVIPGPGGTPAALAWGRLGVLLVVGEVQSGQLAVMRPFQSQGAGFRDAFLAMFAPDTPALAVVNAARYRGPELAPESLVSLFGSGLAPATATAAALPLPTSLSGASVVVRDASGREQQASLIFASPGQINLVLPAGISGEVDLRVMRDGQAVATVSCLLEAVAPALFTADASGRGLAAAVVVRIASGGTQTTVSAAAIEPIAESERAVLLLFGTGIRGRSDSVSVTIAGQPATVLFAGPQAQFAGLDQVNVEIPRGLSGVGLVEVLLQVDGRFANPVEISLR